MIATKEFAVRAPTESLKWAVLVLHIDQDPSKIFQFNDLEEMESRRQTNVTFEVVLILWILTAIQVVTQAANILGFFPISAINHNSVFNALTRELALRGHHVTMVTPFPVKVAPDNYEQIDVSKAVLKHFQGFDKVNVMGVGEFIGKLYNISKVCCRATMELPEVQKLMDPAKSGIKYDLFLTSNFFSDCFLGFSHVYDIPIVMISPVGVFPHADALVGNVALPSYIPSSYFPFTDRMTFLQRTVNLMAKAAMKIHYSFVLYPSQEKIMKEFFGDSVPPLQELHRRTSLILVNTHFTYNYPRPTVPSLVEIGGIHVRPTKPLPEELANYMDEAKHGVILFSMGSNMKSINIPDDIRRSIFNVFSELKQKVLWKWEGDNNIPGKPDNVRLEKWLPQSDLLAHPNMKIFITHGGLLNYQEAVERGVPVIGIPFYSDQDLNMERVHTLGVGIKLHYNELTEDTLLYAINEILYNTSYETNMKELSARVKDQPLTPLENAVFWTEYVIRHKGAKHLSTAALDLSWCQLYMVDVITVLIAVPTIISFAYFYLISRCCRRLFRKTESKQVIVRYRRIKYKRH